MKKIISLFFAIMFAAFMLAGCMEVEGFSEIPETEQEQAQNEKQEQAPVDEPESTETTDSEQSEKNEAETETTQEQDASTAAGVAPDGIPFGNFTTTSIYGHEVTQNIFSEYDLTMVNIWATWCPPCVGEMDELEEVYQSLPENVNMITLCDDGAIETDLALEILAENGCTFDAIVPNNEIYANFMSSNITAFPTTIFVDNEGTVFGPVIQGAPYEPVPYYLDAVDEALGLLT